MVINMAGVRRPFQISSALKLPVRVRHCTCPVRHSTSGDVDACINISVISCHSGSRVADLTAAIDGVIKQRNMTVTGDIW